MPNHHVLVFDSGLGGLSIVNSIKTHCAPVCVSYLGDNALFPYGELDTPTLIERVVTLIAQVDSSLKIDAIVIACNTASTAVLDALRARLTTPVIGVVPAIKPAAALSTKKIIGLIATPATVNRRYTDHLIQSFASDCTVLKVGSTALVECAEHTPDNSQTIIDDTLSAWHSLPSEQQPDVAVLGCTHFPLIADKIQQTLGSNVILIDSGEAVAKRVNHILEYCPEPKHINVNTGCLHAYFTDIDSITDRQRITLINSGFMEIRPWAL